MSVYAHSLPNVMDQSQWERMDQHEDRVAQRCREFLARIHPDLADWGDLLGRWHDLGKYSDAFQQYICQGVSENASSETRSGRVDHSTAGAQLADGSLGKIGRLLAYCIAGHHAGLADWRSKTGNPASGLESRLRKPIEDYSAAPAELLKTNGLPLPNWAFDTDNVGFQLSMLIRFCFSGLCDADFLATEAFMSKNRAAERQQGVNRLQAMRTHLASHVDNLQSSKPSAVNRMRTEVHQRALDASRLPPGLFSLNVPTGGGKTLASLSFAINHAITNDMDRVIYAIPFTSIIEQTVDTFREVFLELGDEIVLEHHSNLDADQESVRARLATENWDSPLVVTTNVQFFESLFASNTARCRKLHRIARSVIILDEVQTLPVHLLEPCLSTLRELCRLFGCTIVLCTATQPAFTICESFPIGFNPEEVTQIIPNPDALHSRSKRVATVDLGRTEIEDVCSAIVDQRQVLCIVNTRLTAAEIYNRLTNVRGNDVCTFHLSTFMCAAHRTAVLKEIKRRLCAGEDCRVVSTQLIEAGVDVDFPVVYRAIAGLDSIAQAAGRCNREGKVDMGKLYVFDTGERLRGQLGATAAVAREVIPDHEDILGLDAIEHYFRLHFWQQATHWDEYDVMSCLTDPMGKEFEFRTAADRFKMIDDASRSVFVPWSSEGERLEEELRSAAFIDRRLRRKVGRYLVPIYENAFTAMVGRDIDIACVEGIPLLLNRDIYDDKIGMRLDRAGQHEP